MKKIWTRNKGAGLAVAALTVVALALCASAANSVDGQFGVFGNSRLVIGGVPPDNAAVDLTSNCGAQPYSTTCYTNTPPFTFSGLSFIPKNSFTVADITNLSTDYNFGGADCGGGSPRFEIFLAGGSGSDHLSGFLGPFPNFTNCYFGWLNTGNLTTDPTTRWQFDLNNINISWSTVQATYGPRVVTEIDIVLDGGWITPKGQDATIDNFTVNNKVMHANDAFHH